LQTASRLTGDNIQEYNLPEILQTVSRTVLRDTSPEILQTVSRVNADGVQGYFTRGASKRSRDISPRILLTASRDTSPNILLPASRDIANSIHRYFTMDTADIIQVITRDIEDSIRVLLTVSGILQKYLEIPHQRFCRKSADILYRDINQGYFTRDTADSI
jgi:hypothetical protein